MKRSVTFARNLKQAQNTEELGVLARRRLPHFAWEYLEGGAEDELTLQHNRSAYRKIKWLPRTLVSSAEQNTAVNILGRNISMPAGIGPSGYNGMLWKDADIHLARAANAMNIPFTLSTVSTTSLEDLVKAAPHTNLWFQLYCLNDRAVQEDLVKRALKAGCTTLILTTDATVLGKREWDKRNFAGPQNPTWRNKLDVLMHPGWMKRIMWPDGMPTLANLNPYLPESHRNAAGAAHFMNSQMDVSLNWKDLERLRALWPHKLLVKGILHPADALKAAERGADGIVITNHGGRQLDTTVSPLDVLPDIRRAVGDDITLIVDSGLRRGGDIAKARALGADMTLLGRAVLYGVALGGTAGASRALEMLREELLRTLALTGCTDIQKLDRSFLYEGAGLQGEAE